MNRADASAGRSPSTAEEIPGYQRAGEESSHLVILLHAYMMGPDSLWSVREVVAAQHPDADFYIPSMPTGLFSFADPIAIVQGLLVAVDRLSALKGVMGYAKITLIGHSHGALLARKLYVCACGENGDAPFEDGLGAARPRPWAGRIDRIILLAGLNRGWSVSHHLSLAKLVGWTTGRWLAGWVMAVSKRQPLIMTIHRGAPFIAQLRLQWLSMSRQARTTDSSKSAAKQRVFRSNTCRGATAQPSARRTGATSPSSLLEARYPRQPCSGSRDDSHAWGGQSEWCRQ